MGILQRLCVTDDRTLLRRPEDPVPATVSISHVEDPSPLKFTGVTYETAYRTRIVGQTIWYANDAQVEFRREIAHQELIELLYGPILARLTKITARAMDRDYRAVVAEVDAIREELKP